MNPFVHAWTTPNLLMTPADYALRFISALLAFAVLVVVILLYVWLSDLVTRCRNARKRNASAQPEFLQYATYEEREAAVVPPGYVGKIALERRTNTYWRYAGQKDDGKPDWRQVGNAEATAGGNETK